MAQILRMTDISKSFPGVKALRNVDFELDTGDVHALVGENGAGKSTLMKILSGMYQPDSGEILLKDQRIEHADPRTMLDAGVSTIYQELNLIPHLSVAENVFLGREPRTRIGLIDWKRMHEQFVDLLEPFDLSVDPRALVRFISPAYQQVVEIVKALALESDIIVMDEPTAPLTGHEVDRLFATIHQLKERGVSIVYISHRLEEIFEVANRVTVLRDGQKISSQPLEGLDVPAIIRMMVGHDIAEQYPKADIEHAGEVLRVEGLSRAGTCSDVSFHVRGGEIVGFAGLVGAGRTEIMQLLFGYRQKDAGRVFVNGKEVFIHSPKDAVSAGIALIPEERKKQGLILGMSVFDNIGLAVLDLHSEVGVIRRRDLGERVGDLVSSMEIKTPSVRQTVRNLSGGNQQKVVLSKWFIRHCDVYIFDEPTRGIDVGAKVEIYRLMQALAERGAAIIMVSSDLIEVMNMSDRILVVYDGRITGEFNRGEATSEQVLQRAFGFAEDGSPEKHQEESRV